MTKAALKYVFILLGTLVVSLVLWSVFIGQGRSISDIPEEGTAFEEMWYGNSESGFKALCAESWLHNSGYNGILDADIRDNTYAQAPDQPAQGIKKFISAEGD